MKPGVAALLLALAALPHAPAWAQDASGGHDEHSGHGAAAEQSAPTTPVQKSDVPPQPAAEADAGSTPTRDAAAPAGARDPHAYSGGYTLEEGPYALTGGRRLRLADEHHMGGLLVDRLERAKGDDDRFTAYDITGWYGRDYNRVWLKAEGHYADGGLDETRTEVLYGRAIANFWDAQAGVRYDTGHGPNRSWLGFGVQGLAPYWFEVEATAYVGEGGRTAARFEAEYDLLLTQRLILQPRAELSLHGKNDEANGIGRGLSDASLGLRLRYEFSRQFAPYIGVERVGKFGRTADFARDEGEATRDTRYVAGVRFWF